MMNLSEFKCRSCGNQKLDTILNLGATPLANQLLDADKLSEEEEFYSLELVYCHQCHLVQITESVSPEKLFSNYVYFSSFSDTMLQHSRKLVETLIENRSLDSNNLVLEIASNDGYLLQYYQPAGIKVLGIEPAQNIAQVAQEKGIPTLAEFFSADLAEKLAIDGQFADIIHANNVMAHVPDLNGVVLGFKRILKPEGIIVSESPYVKDLIDHVEFDTIYHEHLFYYSLTAQSNLFSRHGLTIYDVEHLPIHGGSLRIYAGHSDKVEITARCKAILEEEKRRGLDTLAFYTDFAERIEAIKDRLCAKLAELKAEGVSIAAYGASAKGSTLLNYFQIGKETLDFVVDRSTVKQGLFTPGTHLPILAPSALLEQKPDYVLLLVWNFAEEILQQQESYRQQGGKFIIPLPEIKIL